MSCRTNTAGGGGGGGGGGKVGGVLLASSQRNGVVVGTRWTRPKIVSDSQDATPPEIRWTIPLST